MNRQERKLGKRFSELLGKRLQPLVLRTFGSRARGEADEDSDFDVLVVVETLDHDTDRFISECAWEAGFEYGVLVAPLAYSRADYEREAAAPLLQAIEREGKPI